MSQNFYISDLHQQFGHANILRFDNRPFSNVQDMERTIIKNWNERVTKDDTVYILGDFCWGLEDEWIRILDQLNGMKVLIRGNHDLKNPSANLKRDSVKLQTGMKSRITVDELLCIIILICFTAQVTTKMYGCFVGTLTIEPMRKRNAGNLCKTLLILVKKKQTTEDR